MRHKEKGRGRTRVTKGYKRKEGKEDGEKQVERGREGQSYAQTKAYDNEHESFPTIWVHAIS